MYILTTDSPEWAIVVPGGEDEAPPYRASVYELPAQWEFHRLTNTLTAEVMQAVEQEAARYGLTLDRPGAVYHTQSTRRVGRPAGVKPIRVHLLIPPDLLARFDTKRGDVPRLTMIRRLMAEYIQKQEGNK